MDWYQIHTTNTILTPSLAFYQDRIENNIQKMLGIAGSVERLRPHIKTVKCSEITQMLINAGITKFKCATLNEASMLAKSKAPDVLIAYPLIGNKQKALLQLATLFPETKFSVLIDNQEQIKTWKEQPHHNLGFFLDIDVGMGRTGIPVSHINEILDLIDESSLKFKGYHLYDGHIHNTDLQERKNAVAAAFRTVIKVLDDRNDGLERICGGSITFPIHALFENRTLSPGTTLLWDWGYHSKFPDLNFDIAATIISTVISHIGSNKICIDLGHKAIASEMPAKRVYFPQLPSATITMHSEEHMVLEVGTNNQLPIGTLLYGIPWHICPTVALHEQAQVIKNGDIIDTWQIDARNRIYSI